MKRDPPKYNRRKMPSRAGWQVEDLAGFRAPVDEMLLPSHGINDLDKDFLRKATKAVQSAASKCRYTTRAQRQKQVGGPSEEEKAITEAMMAEVRGLVRHKELKKSHLL